MDQDAAMKIKRGTLLVLETGEYSDYTFHGPFRVMKGFDEVKVVDLHRKQWKPENPEWDTEPDTDSFMGWLTAQGYIEPVENLVSWHIGSYGRLEADPHPDHQPSAAER